MTDRKHSDDKITLIKDEKEAHKEYIFQKDKPTKWGFYLVVSFLLVLVIALITSGIFFETPKEI